MRDQTEEASQSLTCNDLAIEYDGGARCAEVPHIVSENERGGEDGER